MKQLAQAKFAVGDHGEYIIENYNNSKNFASFLPGIAGKMGIPMWVFYVNRGQGICSMGIQDKENPIMEFLPANWAYQLVSSQGFRTFLKLGDSFYEPFMNHLRDSEMDRSQYMIIHASHLVLEEENRTLGLKFKVEYHPIPEDNFAGIIRTLSIENIGETEIKMNGLDGLPLIVPHGIDNGQLKFVRRLTEAFVVVDNYDNGAPLFKTKVIPADRPDVVHLEKGNFYLGIQNKELVDPLVDPTCIFGHNTDYAYPSAFMTTALEDLYKAQTFENRLPSAMSPFEKTLSSGETFTLDSIIGHADSAAFLNAMVPRITDTTYLNQKKKRNPELINEITRSNLVVSADAGFDMYVQQNFLDNVMRGGFPYTLKGKHNESVLHLYSRKHGDLERDYNHYRVTPSHYSQGNANYRDINQNRRSDLFFNPDVGSGNIEHFFNLIQLDGFNPLVIKELRYSAVDKDKVMNVLNDYLDVDLSENFLEYLAAPRTPGEMIDFLQETGHSFAENADEFFGDLLNACQTTHDADFGEGYWSDHWTYNLDLIENYLAVFPENKSDLLFGRPIFTYYDSPHRVKPRTEKYVLWDGKPVQLDSVYLDTEKAEMLEKTGDVTPQVRVDMGSGEVFRTDLFTKIMTLIVNKMASLDPSGIGIEMETDKPNWYDALNGLPALVGSSLNETLELKRLMAFTRQSILEEPGDKQLTLFEELHEFMLALQGALENSKEALAFWDTATGIKEAFREQIRFGVSGQSKSISSESITAFLDLSLEKIEAGIAKAFKDGSEIPSTYFSHQIKEYELTERKSERGLPIIDVKAFELHHLPLFLEGPVHYLRTLPSQEQAGIITRSIRESGLYDKKLQMYKVNEVLDNEPHEIGRARTFTPGWFENESIWLHMEYKYMLEMLRNGLYDRFYDEFKQVFIPFLDPQVYGRSIFENSSFLVSSANPDPSIHGTGYVSRLSGATAEFIHILLMMAMGSEPFELDEDEHLTFKVEPALPGWLFTTEAREIQLGEDNSIKLPENSFSFRLFGKTLVTYHNPGRKDTFGPEAVQPRSWRITDTEGNVDQFEGKILGTDLASKIRAGRVASISIELK